MLDEIKMHTKSHQNEQDFESLLANFSASFVNTPPDELDQRINAALQDMGQFLAIDLLEIWLIDPAETKYKQAYRWIKPGITPPSDLMEETCSPFLSEHALDGETVVLSRFEELTTDAGRDVAILQSSEVKSTVVLPLVAGNSELGVIYFESLSSDRIWPEKFVVRLQLIGEIFANVFLQCQKERDLQSALEENIELRQRLETENKILQEDVYHTHETERVIGHSEAFGHVLKQVGRVAQTDSTVLLLGETGTGKDLVANRIHLRSRRAHQPLIRVNCAALPETLFESELFGHEKGAFTGSVSRKIGRFELADSGTLVLDEIGEMPLHSQPKLLRALQTGEYERLGSEKTRIAHVRLIASTNRDLEEMAEKGAFRPDLFYRINVFPITMPPLRARKEDIPFLVEFFVEKLQSHVNRKITFIPDETMEALKAYDWPGNIRELQNVIERSLILSPGGTLSVVGLLKKKLSTTTSAMPMGGNTSIAIDVKTLDEVNRDYIRAVCERCGWKIHGTGNAAELLGINPNTLRARMKKLGVERPAMVG
jgi:formate hydrogenlyase transcriptional activator